MSDKRIMWICGVEPNREGEYPTMFTVGKNGVTSITVTEDYYGDHAIAWFDIHFGDEVLQRMQARAVAEVRYFANASAE